MNVLIAGGSKQAWQIRGHQLGNAIGARVRSKPSEADVKWADVVVLVKKGGPIYASMVHACKKPLVWDALDFWEQPDQNEFSKQRSLLLLAEVLANVNPTLTIGATERMAKACRGVFLPHHSWQGLEPTPSRETVELVAYQGKPTYLGVWQEAIEVECAKRGWRFEINPPDLRPVDILVAFRDGIWDGWMCQNWKSGVKAVNAIAAGRPLITGESHGAIEMPHSGSVVKELNGLAIALDYWADPAARRRVAENSHDSHAYTLESVAETYLSILQRVA